MDNFQGSLNNLYLLNSFERRADPAVDAKDRFINYSSEWEEFENIIDSIEDRVREFCIFPQPIFTFVEEPKTLIYPSVFMVSAEQKNLVRKFDFQGEE